MTTLHHIYDIAGGVSLLLDFVVLMAFLVGRIIVHTIDDTHESRD